MTKPIFRAFPLAALVALCTLPAVPLAAAHAETIASKVVQLGQMNQVSVSALRATERNGRLLLQVQFTNASTGYQSLAYRVKWLDQDQFSVWEDEAWKPLMLNGLQSVNVQALAPTRAATDFRIEVHAVDNSAPAMGAR